MDPSFQILYDDCRELDKQRQSDQVLLRLADYQLTVDSDAQTWSFGEDGEPPLSSGPLSELNGPVAEMVIQIEIWRAQAHRNLREINAALQTIEAIDTFENNRGGKPTRYLSAEILGLRAACHKQRYLETRFVGDLRIAIQCYRDGWEAAMQHALGHPARQHAVWHGINAATLMLCDGEEAAAKKLFTAVLEEVEALNTAIRADSWSALTAIECLLGLGTPSGALAALLQRLQLTEMERGSFRGQLEGIWAIIGARSAAYELARRTLLAALS
jgi:hypothetical protein